MQNFAEWFQTQAIRADQPWLILGKGPSFSLREQFDLEPYRLLSLNHAVRELPVHVAHIIDFDVVGPCAEALERNARVLVMPWIPHIKNDPGEHTLEELTRTSETLKRLDEQGRLLWYNCSTAGPRIREGHPVIPVKFFSAEAAVNLLAAVGVRRIRTLGVDGGSTYSAKFSDLKDKTLLANGRTSFNAQFGEIAKTIRTKNLDFGPLHIPSPVRVYVATTEAEMLPTKVLEFSIKKHASITTEVFPLCRSEIPIPKPRTAENLPRTPFSFQRFLIPELAGYQGRAIYFDADMQLFRDIKDLWSLPLADVDVLAVGNTRDPNRRPQFSVMLLNCDRLRWNIREIVEALDRGALKYEQLMYEMRVAKEIRPDIDPSWNCLERYDEKSTALLHYTDMPTQPWVYADHPHGDLWVRDLLQAIGEGFLSREYVQDHIRKGYVRPSLDYQIEHGIDNGLLLPRRIRALDRTFRAPYHSLPGQRDPQPSWFRPIKVLGAHLRALIKRTPVMRVVRGMRNKLLRTP